MTFKTAEGVSCIIHTSSVTAVRKPKVAGSKPALEFISGFFRYSLIRSHFLTTKVLFFFLGFFWLMGFFSQTIPFFQRKLDKGLFLKIFQKFEKRFLICLKKIERRF